MRNDWPPILSSGGAPQPAADVALHEVDARGRHVQADVVGEDEVQVLLLAAAALHALQAREARDAVHRVHDDVAGLAARRTTGARARGAPAAPSATARLPRMPDELAVVDDHQPAAPASGSPSPRADARLDAAPASAGLGEHLAETMLPRPRSGTGRRRACRRRVASRSARRRFARCRPRATAPSACRSRRPAGQALQLEPRARSSARSRAASARARAPAIGSRSPSARSSMRSGSISTTTVAVGDSSERRHAVAVLDAARVGRERDAATA